VAKENVKQVDQNEKPKPGFQQARHNLEKMVIDPKIAAKLKANQVDLMRKFVLVFGSPAGKEVLDYLDKYSHRNFPNYGNGENMDGISAVLATYSKCGEQALISHIRDVLNTARKAGE